MAWATSTRRARLPSDWAKRAAKVKARAQGRCQAKYHEPECDGIGTECDHVRRGDDHSLANLQWLSSPCHAAKTQAEAQAALSARRAALRLPGEQHPGKTWGSPPPPPTRHGPRG